MIIFFPKQLPNAFSYFTNCHFLFTTMEVSSACQIFSSNGKISGKKVASENKPSQSSFLNVGELLFILLPIHITSQNFHNQRIFNGLRHLRQLHHNEIASTASYRFDFHFCPLHVLTPKLITWMTQSIVLSLFLPLFNHRFKIY